MNSKFSISYNYLPDKSCQVVIRYDGSWVNAKIYPSVDEAKKIIAKNYQQIENLGDYIDMATNSAMYRAINDIQPSLNLLLQGEMI